MLDLYRSAESKAALTARANTQLQELHAFDYAMGRSALSKGDSHVIHNSVDILFGENRWREVINQANNDFASVEGHSEALRRSAARILLIEKKALLADLQGLDPNDKSYVTHAVTLGQRAVQADDMEAAFGTGFLGFDGQTNWPLTQLVASLKIAALLKSGYRKVSRQHMHENAERKYRFYPFHTGEDKYNVRTSPEFQLVDLTSKLDIQATQRALSSMQTKINSVFRGEQEVEVGPEKFVLLGKISPACDAETELSQLKQGIGTAFDALAQYDASYAQQLSDHYSPEAKARVNATIGL